MAPLWRKLVAVLGAPTDPAGLAAFRFLYGALVALGSARFLDSGWPEKLYGTPTFFFRFAGFSQVPVPDGDTARTLYGVFVVLGIAIATGTLYRLSMAAFVVLFAWVQLGDVTNYLNHYWLVLLLGTLLAVVPAHATWSVDAWLLGSRRATVPFAAVAALRFQVACVYVFAAVAKLGPDWLLYGQPLGVWLPPRSSIPLIGPLLLVPWVPLVLSWGGFLYDSAIVPLLLWRRSRPFAYALVVVFHGLTRAFFEIGMFPFIMVTATTLFFAPDWPRRLIGAAGGLYRRFQNRRIDSSPLDRCSDDPVGVSPPSEGGGGGGESGSRPLGRFTLVALGLWCAVQLLLPLRTFAIGNDVLWDETGMRWSWRVMVREKSGTLDYRVTFTDPAVGRRTVLVSPHAWLTWRQVNEMIGQPDLILQLAHTIRDDFMRRGFTDVEVRADCRLTLNGRPAAPFIDPVVDLARVDDCLFCRPAWVLPPPTTTPPSPWRSVGHRLDQP
jgi:vitamin K-dependent gamma-carboxylase